MTHPIPIRAHRLLVGLAAGDSLGSTSEFAPDIHQVLTEQQGRSDWPLEQAGGGAFQWPVGAPTDDTDMACAILRGYEAATGQVSTDRIAQEFVAWYRSSPPDIGNTTSSALAEIASGTEAWRGGEEAFLRAPDRAGANGALMRNGPVVGLARHREAALRLSWEHSLMTHWGPKSVLAALLQTSLLWELEFAGASLLEISVPDHISRVEQWLHGVEDVRMRAWLEAVSNCGGVDWIQAALVEQRRAHWDLRTFHAFEEARRRSDGCALLTLQIGLWARFWAEADEPCPFEWRPVEHEIFDRTGAWVLGWVAMIGFDSDTYGATAGAFLANFDLPSAYVEGLSAPREFEPV